MGTKSPSFPRSAAANTVLTREELDLEEALRRVRGRKYGAVISFVGSVRDTEGPEPILSLSYEAYEEMAQREITRIVSQAEKLWNVKACVFHRTGEIPAGEAALIVACAGEHRLGAFAAVQSIIDKIKNSVPIWKTAFKKSP